MDKKYTPMSDADVTRSFEDSTPVVRLCFLRLHLYHQHWKAEADTNWELIHEHLDKIKGKSQNYKQACVLVPDC